MKRSPDERPATKRTAAPRPVFVPPEGEPIKPRYALSNLGGPTTQRGDPRASEILAEAMDRAASEDPDALTHGFHPWPARMHRAIAGVIIARLTEPGDRVLDPFCGSGTVLLEAMLAGRRSAGVDLNPITGPLLRAKCARRDATSRQRFVETAILVGEASIDRVQARERALAKLPPSMLGLYGTHTLKEMAGLLEEIRSVEDEADRSAMEMVFSSLVVKVSNKRGETAIGGEVRKRIRKGLVTEMFVRKVEELAGRWADLERAMPEDAIEPRFFEGDALKLRSMLGDDTKVKLVLSSPPYGGTYDYHAQHAIRIAWLGLDARGLAKREIGARRATYDDADEAQERWHEEVADMLSALSGVLAPDGAAVLLMGDGKIGTQRVPLLPQLAELAPTRGLELIAAASQPRMSWTGGPPREEHLVLLAPRAGQPSRGSDRGPRREDSAPRRDGYVSRDDRGDRPAPRGDRPAPRDDRPAPRDDRPAPRDDRPAPRGDRPAPRGDRPAPRGGRPAPRGGPKRR